MGMVFSELQKQIGGELLNKAKEIEKISDFRDLDQTLTSFLGNLSKYDIPREINEKFDSNSKIEIDGNICETDDNGDMYKENGVLLPSKEYVINGTNYTTDAMNRIVSWEAHQIELSPENERDGNAQAESGGEDRLEGDDGGHLVARYLGGSPGKENIVPMRATINRGDYKKTENDIVEARKEGKSVLDSGQLIYENNSSRPTKIERTYIIDGNKNIAKLDNVKGSKDLLSDIKGSISDEDMERISDEILDMEEDGCEVTVTSVLKRYDSDDKLISVCVGIRNESTGEKTYQTYRG